MGPNLLESFQDEFKKRTKSGNQWIRRARRGKYWHKSFDETEFLNRFPEEVRSAIANGHSTRRTRQEKAFAEIRAMLASMTEEELEDIRKEMEGDEE